MVVQVGAIAVSSSEVANRELWYRGTLGDRRRLDRRFMSFRSSDPCGTSFQRGLDEMACSELKKLVVQAEKFRETVTEKALAPEGVAPSLY